MQKERKGELYIFGELILWSLFPVITVLSFASFSPLVSLTWATCLSTFFFIAVMFYKGTWKELANATVWKYGVLIALFIGVGYYGFYFFGLQYTSPGNAAIIALFEIFTTYVLFQLLRKERFPIEHKIGAAFMLVGALIVLGKNFSGINVGDFLILGATLISPFGNLYQQKARTIASSETIMFLRSALATGALFCFVLLFGEELSISSAYTAWPYLLVNGVVLFGLSKLFWIEGIHRVSVTKATALHPLGPFLTLLFAWFLLSQAPTIWQLSSLVPFILGVLLLTGQFRAYPNRVCVASQPFREREASRRI